MQVGQYISIKSNTDYVDIYDAPAITSKSEGFTAGYVGKVSKVNVAGIGESRFYTEVINKNGEKKYIDTADDDLFESSSTNPTDNNSGSDETDPSIPTPAPSGESTFDKIANIFSGILGIFNSTKSKNKTPNTGEDKTTDPTAKDGETPDPSNNADSPLLVWLKANWLLALILIIIVPGGLILGISALIKASKKKNEIAAQKPPYNGNKI